MNKTKLGIVVFSNKKGTKNVQGKNKEAIAAGFVF